MEDALSRHDLLSDIETLVRWHETNHVAQPRIRLLVRMRDAHTTANGDVEARQTAVRLVSNGNKANVRCVNIDVVVRRYGNVDLELSREIDGAVERFKVFDGLAGNELLVEPDPVHIQRWQP